MLAAPAGSVQLTLRSPSACIAFQVLLATTATASPRPTTAMVPAGLRGFARSVPPMTGEWRTAAKTMPGNITSIP